MRLPRLEFGSLLTYCPRGDSEKIQNSKNIMYAIKGDKFVDKPQILMSQWIAKTISNHRASLPFDSFFQHNTILVPVPKSSLMRPDTLWAPQRIANALASQGLGKEVALCLVRNKPVIKSATSPASMRPTPDVHYDSLIVQEILSEPNEILLVDDIVTRGSTLLGSANRLADVYPQARIRAFAAMRTISNPDDFNKVNDPCIGTIELRELGDTIRRP